MVALAARRRLMAAQQVADGLDDKARQGATMVGRMKFICDTERCIDCNGCATACENESEAPWGMHRRRVVPP